MLSSVFSGRDGGMEALVSWGSVHCIACIAASALGVSPYGLSGWMDGYLPRLRGKRRRS